MTQVQSQQMVRRMDNTPKGAVLARLDTIVRALPQNEGMMERFKQAATSIAMSPDIAECEPESVVKAIYVCARLNLIPDPIQQKVYIVPFRDHGVKKATTIVGYKGFIELARRAEPQLFIDVGTVHEGDDYTLTRGSDAKLTIQREWWEKGLDKPGKMLFSWCVSAMPGQEKRLVLLSAQEGLATGKKSKGGYQPGRPWYDSFEAMCEKTTIRRSARLWSLSPTRQEARQLMAAIESDEADTDGLDMPDSGITLPDANGEPQQQQQEGPPAGNFRMGGLGDESRPVPMEQATSVDPAARGRRDAELAAARRRQQPAGDIGAIDKSKRDKQQGQPAQPKPAAAPKQQQELSPVEQRREMLQSLGMAVTEKLEQCGLPASDINQLKLMTHVAGDDPKTQIAAADITKLKIWRGDVLAMDTAGVKEIINPPMPQGQPPPQEQEDDSQDRVEEVTEAMIVDMWVDIRQIDRTEAVRGFEQLLKLRYEKDWEDITPAEKLKLRDDVASGRVKFNLFDGIKK